MKYHMIYLKEFSGRSVAETWKIVASETGIDKEPTTIMDAFYALSVYLTDDEYHSLFIHPLVLEIFKDEEVGMYPPTKVR